MITAIPSCTSPHSLLPLLLGPTIHLHSPQIHPTNQPLTIHQIPSRQRPHLHIQLHAPQTILSILQPTIPITTVTGIYQRTFAIEFPCVAYESFPPCSVDGFGCRVYDCALGVECGAEVGDFAGSLGVGVVDHDFC